MTTMVQDLIKSDKVVTLGTSTGSDDSNHENMAYQLTEIETRLADLEKQMNGGSRLDTEEAKKPVVDGKASPYKSKIMISLFDITFLVIVCLGIFVTGETSSPSTTANAEVSSNVVALRSEVEQLRKELIDLTSKIESSGKS